MNEDLKTLSKLLFHAVSWNTEDSKYICLDWWGKIYFSNEIDCDGVMYWTKKSLLRFAGRRLNKE